MAELSLEVVEGPDAGHRLPVAAPVEIGREAGVDMLLEDQLVSRRHARVTPAEGGVTVEDLGSRNGTFVNGNQIYSPAHASAGDQILVGVSVIQLRSGEQIAERPSAVRAVPQGLATPERRPDYLPPDLQAPGGAPATVGEANAPPPSPRARGQAVVPELDPLLDRHTKRRALLAPLAVFVVAALVLIVFLASR